MKSHRSVHVSLVPVSEQMEKKTVSTGCYLDFDVTFATYVDSHTVYTKLYQALFDPKGIAT